MHFEYNDKTKDLINRVRDFMIEHIYPNEEEMLGQIQEGDHWEPIPMCGIYSYRKVSVARA